ncbi:ABC transporter permease [Pseudoroseicyclus tamaricis]|uniref:Transport permease protein n=1 Tax=Pseudoroseicyclus tamaricis TaxID=2705421 RepID=A0A6B2JPE8_9RHOB|nr:ABC transporter permease [Pseudoroseicyclus tamaricis]NDU99967.1 ABC transporter permease [Pseudoroseicyclus tamaricis]
MFWRDTWTIFRRQMILSLRNPAWVLIGLLQPIMYLTLFGPLLEQVASVPGFPPGDSWKIFVPGLLVQLGIFGGFFVGFAVIAEWRAGVVDRMLVSPAPRGALILGRVLRDVVSLTVQGAVLMAAATLFGLAVPLYVMGLGLLLVALLGGAFSAFSYAAGLALKSEDSFAPLINMFALPVLLLSGILLPMSLAPRWLQVLSDINPFKHVVDGLRAVFLGDILSMTAAFGFGLALALMVLGLWVGARVFSGQVK